MKGRKGGEKVREREKKEKISRGRESNPVYIDARSPGI